jgi:hypothetical protein
MSADPQILATVFVRVEDTGSGDLHTEAKCKGIQFSASGGVVVRTRNLPRLLARSRAPRGLIINARRNVESALVRLHSDSYFQKLNFDDNVEQEHIKSCRILPKVAVPPAPHVRS